MYSFYSFIRNANTDHILKKSPNFNLADKLIGNMVKRAPSLFKSPLFLCSVFLDPRIMFTLSDEQKAVAAMDLVKIHERIIESSNKGEESANNTLDEIQQEFHAQHCKNQNQSNEFLKVISIYESDAINTPYDMKKPVMQFWEGNAQKYSILRSLANILHAVPSNQTCTERAFSSLSYIRSNNVLMVRLNKDVYYSLRAERCQEILKSQ